jgi:hypothetical protein
MSSSAVYWAVMALSDSMTAGATIEASNAAKSPMALYAFGAIEPLSECCTEISVDTICKSLEAADACTSKDFSLVSIGTTSSIIGLTQFKPGSSGVSWTSPNVRCTPTNPASTGEHDDMSAVNESRPKAPRQARKAIFT